MSTPPPYADELELALRAVHAASLLTKSVLRSLKNNVSAETKADDSPVTIADFAAQALIITAVYAVYPEDSFIGEESAEALRQNDALADRVWELVQQAAEAHSSQSGDAQYVHTHDGYAALTFPTSKDDMLNAIDLGAATEQTRRGRVWVMDPVDGTLSFMTNKQYAVCLCLLVDGVQHVGVIACPNLQFNVHGPLGQSRIHEDQVDEADFGVVLSAVKGQGTFVRTMHAAGFGEARRVERDQKTPKPHRALDFVEATLGKTSLSQAEHRAVAELLGTQWPGTVIWSQQMKYVALTLGATDVMVRLPKGMERYTYVWDHAGGQLLFQEVGGIIRDIDHCPIDLGQGRKILGSRNFGMVAAMPSAYVNVLQAVERVLERRRQGVR
jgi:3'(2'), 5'-bisphosphate nucleotidase